MLYKCVCGFIFFPEDIMKLFKKTKVEGDIEEGIVECPECGSLITIRREITT